MPVLAHLVPLLLATASPDLAAHLRGLDGCVLVHDLTRGKPVLEHGGARCAARVSPCSTFKVALALMAIDQGLIADETTTFAWDGERREMASWNADQTAADWMRNSTLWVSQVLTARLGAATVTRYLRDFQYGTQDVSGGLDGAWLTAAPGEPFRPTLLISAREQLEFLKRMWRGELPVSPGALAVAKKLTFVERSPGGYVLHGKTGTGFLGPRHDLRLGWFVAHLQRGTDEYVAVVSFTEKQHREPYDTFAGPEAREILKKVFRELGLW